MSSSSSQINSNTIELLPRLFTIRFGNYETILDEDDNNNNDHEQQFYEVLQQSEMSTNEDHSSSIVINGIRNRDWNFQDDIQSMKDNSIPTIKYQLIPSMSNTIKNRSTNFMINNNEYQYEEYDLDEQDFQWLMAYNQFRIEKYLPALDENIFEYIMQLLEHQCLLAIRQKNYEDTIRCDACRRIDDVSDLIQCIQCYTIVHKKCYGIDDDDENDWLCFSCQSVNDTHLCCLCDTSGGALKVLKTSNIQSNEQQPKWVHSSCAFWLSNIEFDKNMTPVLKHALKHDGRCSICNKITGVKLNCCWKNCQNRFHALCAINVGQDMLIAEHDDRLSIRLLALCRRHTKKTDLSEKRIQKYKLLENQQKRFEQFTSYVNLESIQKETSILPDVLDSIHTYWILKRQGNNCRPLIDIPDDIFYHDHDQKINLNDFRHRYHLEHQDQRKNLNEETTNLLPFLTTNVSLPSSSNNNLFIRYARKNRIPFSDYERNRFCLLDGEKKKREGILEYLSSTKETI